MEAAYFYNLNQARATVIFLAIAGYQIEEIRPCSSGGIQRWRVHLADGSAVETFGQAIGLICVSNSKEK